MSCTSSIVPVPDLTPSDVARRFDKHPSAPTRWMTRGVRVANGQRVRLKAVRLPGGWRTSEGWLAEFLDALTTASLSDADGTPPAPAGDASLDPRRLDRQLDALGV